MTDARFREMTDFLRGLGTDDIGHTGSKGFLAHLVSVFHDLDRWGGDQDLCRAGMFHSIYGTEKFRHFCLPIDRRDLERSAVVPSCGLGSGLIQETFMSEARSRHGKRRRAASETEMKQRLTRRRQAAPNGALHGVRPAGIRPCACQV